MCTAEDHATQELRNLIHTANAPIFGTDTDGVITKWNNKVAELTGFSQSETLGKHLVQNFVCPDNRASVQARFYFLSSFIFYFIHLFLFHFVST
jgi:PAS domain S-box-containing protein